MITFYDFVTTVVMLSLFLLWTISTIVLFNKEMSALLHLYGLPLLLFCQPLALFPFFLRHSTKRKEGSGLSPGRKRCRRRNPL